MNIHIISFTQAGFSLSKRIQNLLSHAVSSENFEQITLSFGGKAWDGESASAYRPVSDWVEDFFQKGNALIFIGAAGIAVRTVSDWLAEHPASVDRVIFNVFKDEDKEYYEAELF